MKDLKKTLSSLFNLKFPFINKLTLFWPILGVLLLSIIFFYPVWLENKVPLPADALVGAHVPWTELKWDEYPAGVPIKNQEITDSISQFYPWRSLVGEFWRAGKAPLWNPYMFSGTPFLATLHSASLYPLNFLYLIFDNINAWSGLLFLQIFLSGVFMYLFLRKLELKKEASFLGAATFAFSGYMIAWLEFATGGHAGLWLPLLLLFEMKLLESNRIAWLPAIAFTFFFIFTAGDFQAPLYISATYVLFGVYLILSSGRRKLLLKSFLIMFSGLLLGILISLPQLLPTLELFLGSIRLNDPYIDEYYYGLMGWEKIVNFIWPDFFGNVVTRNYWGKYDYHEHLGFACTVSLVFAILSLLVKKLKHEWFFWILLLFALMFLFPTPIAFLPFKMKIPGLGSSSASRIIYLVDFCLAVLATYGFSKWTSKKDGKLLKVIAGLLLVTGGVALGLFASLYLIKQGNPIGNLEIVVNMKVALRNMVPSTLILLILGFLIFIAQEIIKRSNLKKLLGRFLPVLPFVILLLASAEMLRFAWKNTPFSPRKFVFPKTKITEFLQNQSQPFRIAGGIPLNLSTALKVGSAEGYDSLYPKRNSEWYSLVNTGTLAAISGRYGFIHSFSSSLLDNANVIYVIDYKKNIYGGISEKGDYASGVESPRYKEVFEEGRIKVFENMQALPRVWLSTDYKVISDKGALVDELQIISSTKNKSIIVESEPKLSIIKKDSLNYQVSDYRYGFNEIRFNVVNSTDALLFLSESHYPGWRAYVNGQETEIYRANYLFQAIVIPKGNHEVRFIYDPKSFKIGKVIAVATMFIMAAYIIYDRFIKKGKKNSPRDFA